jgi:hypothetical protein
MSNIALELSTELSPPKLFTIDGEEFQILGVDHLSPDQEAQVTALFAKHSLIATDLQYERNMKKGEQLAQRLRNVRLEILSRLTTAPKETLDRLPLPGQLALLKELQTGLTADDEEEMGKPGSDDSDEL